MDSMVNGIPVHYSQHGTGTPVLALHGGNVDHREIKGALEPVFAERPGYRRIYPDLPGMGRTPATETIDSTDAVLDTLLGLVDDVIGEEAFLVVGHSYGGYLARAIANRRPGQVAGLALICSLAGEQVRGDERPEHVVLRAADGLDLDGTLEPTMAAEFRNYLVVQTPETLRRFQETVAPGMALADQAAVERIFARWQLRTAPEQATRVHQPNADPGRPPGRHRWLCRVLAPARALSARHLCRAGPCRPRAPARAGRAGDRPDGGMAGPRQRASRRRGRHQRLSQREGDAVDHPPGRHRSTPVRCDLHVLAPGSRTLATRLHQPQYFLAQLHPLVVPHDSQTKHEPAGRIRTPQVEQ